MRVYLPKEHAKGIKKDLPNLTNDDIANIIWELIIKSGPGQNDQRSL